MDIIESFGDDRATSIFFNVLSRDPASAQYPAFYAAHKQFKKQAAERAIQNIKTPNEISERLKESIRLCNPFLLKKLCKHQPGISYTFKNALLEAANQGSLEPLNILYRARPIPIPSFFHFQIAAKAVARGHSHLVDWLSRILPFPANFLSTAFKAPNWRQMVPLVLSKIPEAEQPEAIRLAALSRIKGSVNKMHFFLAHTPALKVLEPNHWIEIFDQKGSFAVLFSLFCDG